MGVPYNPVPLESLLILFLGDDVVWRPFGAEAHPSLATQLNAIQSLHYHFNLEEGMCSPLIALLIL